MFHTSSDPACSSPSSPISSLRFIPLSYNHARSRESALALVLALFPDWAENQDDIHFARFTDGITNTLLKIVRRTPGISAAELDANAVLMRAYGNHTEILIDRERETHNHALLASRGLAPALLARFENGLLYRYLPGSVSHPDDLIKPRVYRAVARRLAQWHASLPLPTTEKSRVNGSADTRRDGDADAGEKEHTEDSGDVHGNDGIKFLPLRRSGPNLWSILQKWILALPTVTEDQVTRRQRLQEELDFIMKKCDDRSGLGHDGLVFSHCDLLSANVIIEPRGAPTGLADSDPDGDDTDGEESDVDVHFIDYEYAAPAPAAFDIANHFAEWGGYNCDYNMLPTRAVRRDFIQKYVTSYERYAKDQVEANGGRDAVVEKLFHDVDRYRGIPGFYWGIWASIQATISRIDFDYAAYSETRLGEYFDWKDEAEGTREAGDMPCPLRERRWKTES